MSPMNQSHGIPRPPQARPRGRALRWRREQLMAAGYDELTAHRLATDPMLDVHAILETVSAPAPQRLHRLGPERAGPR